MKVKVRVTAVKGEKRKLANSQVVLWPVVDEPTVSNWAWGCYKGLGHVTGPFWGVTRPFWGVQGPTGVYWAALLGC